MSNPISKVVIVGGGTAGWMAAASLIRFAEGKNLSITLIESTEISTIGVGEATIPNIVDFNRNIGVDELAFIKATKATFKLGIQFENWSQLNSAFFHPFADYGLTIDGVEFHQYINRLSALGDKVNLADYSFPCVMAKHNNFAQPHPNPATPLANYSYAYHFDAGLYAKFLTSFATNLGVEHIDAKIEKVSTCPDTGFISSVTLANGNEVSGDLFIDCSGFKGLLIEQTLKTGYEDWSHFLFCDSAQAVQTSNTKAPLVYTRSIAMKCGWQWRIPLQHRTGNGYIYSSKFISDDEAKATLLTTVDGEPLNEPRKITFQPGRRKKIWHKNCFALGLASGFLEPLESTSISLIQTAIAKLLTFFPDSSFNEADIAEVNRLHNQELENIRDFLILHYKLTQRNDSAFWRQCADMEIPDTLQHKISLYKSRGHFVMHENESFERASWLTMYNGFNVKPKRYDIRADAVDAEFLRQKVLQMKQSIANAASQAITHDEFINKHCKA